MPELTSAAPQAQGRKTASLAGCPARARPAIGDGGLRRRAGLSVGHEALRLVDPRPSIDHLGRD
eukprot:15442931-Alexandrium_andersonii.AAC.1